ncbi:MAG: DNA mismatch repair endonuclease MutL [Candidatus Phytoplasma sp.]|nr:DNA mismatch repair endonuclease MutL [Phytoplasma sp.]
MPKINIMDAALSNMIAAGEVVERPASVIKELVENSLDADATQIIIEIKNMGLDLIKVTDNGTGMSKEDAKLAFLRHATSKINSQYDLNHIKSLGFRGEALPSIASVSKVKLETKTKNEDGYFVMFEGSQLVDEGIAALNQGTVITVTDLFYNTPARFKYLKSEIAEKNAIIEFFDKLALSYPSVQFVLKIDEREIKRTLGNDDVLSVMEIIYGKQVTQNHYEFEFEYQKNKIKGYLINPIHTRSRKKDINLFINNRYIKNYLLTQAVIEGYHSFLMTNKYPIASIYITIDPSLIDVNVHPQKMEIKLVNEQVLKYQIEEKIKETLRAKPLEVKPLLTIEKMTKETYSYPETTILKEETSVFDQPLFEFAPKEVEKESLTICEENEFIEKSELEETNKLPHFEYIGTFSGTYLLFQNEEGLYLMDQHAAAERIKYEYYFEKLSHIKLELKQYLIKREIQLPSNDIEKILIYKDEFLKQGFVFEENKLKFVPTWVKDEDIEDIIERFLTLLEENGTIEIIKIRDDLAKDLSCKSAIKANHQLNRYEISQLIKDLNQTKNPYTCPHGRPVWIQLTHHEIEKLFKRIV